MTAWAAVAWTLCVLSGCGREEPSPAPSRGPSSASPTADPLGPSAVPPVMPSLEALRDRLAQTVQSTTDGLHLRIAHAQDGHVVLAVTDAPLDVLEKLWQTKQDPLAADVPEAAALQASLRRVSQQFRSQPGVARVSVKPVEAQTVAAKCIRLARLEIDRRRFDQADTLLDRAERVAPAAWKTAPRWVASVRHMERTRARFKALAMSMLNYHDDRARYPSGVVSGKSRMGQATWLCAMLPYVGAERVYHTYNFSRDYAHPSNRTAIAQVVDAFLAPGRSERRHRGGMGVTHFAGVLLEEMDERHRTFILSVLGRNTCVRIRDIRDGTGHTLLAGQVDRMLPGWAEGDRTLRPIDKGINVDPGRGFESPVPGGALFLFVDGHVRFLGEQIDPSVLRALATYNGNETVDEDQY